VAAVNKSHLDAFKQYGKGVEGFIQWCKDMVRIPGPTGDPIAFELWPEQERAAREIDEHNFVIILKARQLGLTWLCTAYLMWRNIFLQAQDSRVISIKEDLAPEIMYRMRYILKHFPDFMLPPVDKKLDNATTIGFSHSGSRLRSVPSTPDAGRSLTLTDILSDEDAFNQHARDIQTSGMPT
jgi:hypothetical protein